jgi:hypothetical protein
MTRHVVATVALLGAIACDIPGAPKWSADLLFPLDVPDIVLADGVGGVVVPPTDVTFPTAMMSQDVSSGLSAQILGKDIQAISAEIVSGTDVNVTGTITFSIATDPANLFSANPLQAVTVQIPITPADTTTVTADPALFKDAQTLYYQSTVTVRGASPGGTPVTPGDAVRLGANIVATIPVSK